MKRVFIFLLLSLSFIAGGQQKNPAFTIDSFAAQREGNDTRRHVNIFRKYEWEVSAIANNGAKRRWMSTRPDTIDSRTSDTVLLSTSFTVSPQLLNHEFALYYNLSGSLRMTLNEEDILLTGAFVKDGHSVLSDKEQFGFTRFLFRDTSARIKITFLPHPRIRIFDLSVAIFQINEGYEDYYQATINNYRVQSFSFGFYFLSFAVIFLMLFFFFKENKENLHFSLFCFFISLSFFCSIFRELYTSTLSIFSAVLACETICIFLAKVFRNKRRTNIPIIAICIIAAFCLYPPITYHQLVFFGKTPKSVGLYVGEHLLLFYEFYVTFYLLGWGLRLKNNDSKTIFVFCLIASLLYVFLPFAIDYIPAFHDLSFVSYVNYLPNIGLCLLPIGPAIVLGKRNGEKEKLLLEQEKEKKRILENQKESLEQQVEERTMEIVLQKEEIEKQHSELKVEKKKSDDLLLNILPEEVAEELKETGRSEARFFNNVTVLFTDFVDFTKAGERMTPQELVDELHICFKTFDEIISRHNIEKIKTIGDAYLAVCGLPIPLAEHAVNIVNAAVEIRQFMVERKAKLKDRAFDIRIGINSGSLVAGIVGVKKFAYDIWGDTVNTAARMEQSSEAGKINISQTTYDLVKDRFSCQYRGEIEAKNKGKMKMYFVETPGS